MRNYKLMRTNALLLFALSSLAWSCSKKEATLTSVARGEKVSVSFAVSSNDYVEEEIQTKSGLASGELSLGELVDVGQQTGFDVAMHLQKPIVETAAVSTKQAKAVSNPLRKKTKYRLYLFEKNGDFYDSRVLSAGNESDTLMVYKHVEYTWYAYSNNTTSEDDVPDIRSGNDLMLRSGEQDLLWASGTILPSEENLHLNINFEHKLSRLEFIVDYRGLFVYKMENDNFQLMFNRDNTVLTKGVLNLKTGQFVDGSHKGYAVTNNKILVEPDYDDLQRYYYYSSIQQEISRLRMIISGLTYKTYSDQRLAHKQKESIMEKAFNLIPGTSAKVSYIFIESALKAGTSPVKWARANLYCEGDGLRDPFRFRPQNSWTSPIPILSFDDPEKDFWMKNNLKPNTYKSRPNATDTSLYPAGDPCMSVRPWGAWKKPSPADFAALIQTFSSTPGNPYVGVEYLIAPAATGNTGEPYPSDRLIFERAGYIYLSDQLPSTTNGLYLSDLTSEGESPKLWMLISGSNANTWKVQQVDQGHYTATNVRCVRTKLYQ